MRKAKTEQGLCQAVKKLVTSISKGQIGFHNWSEISIFEKYTFNAQWEGDGCYRFTVCLNLAHGTAARLCPFMEYCSRRR